VAKTGERKKKLKNSFESSQHLKSSFSHQRKQQKYLRGKKRAQESNIGTVIDFKEFFFPTFSDKLRLYEFEMTFSKRVRNQYFIDS